MAWNRSPSERELKGRTIVRLELHARRIRNGRAGTITMTDPEIYLDDGSILRFTVQEHPDGGDYGVQLIRSTPAARRRYQFAAAACYRERPRP